MQEAIMKWYLSLHCFVALFMSVNSDLVPNRPPAIFLQPRRDVFYKKGETVRLQCEADGVPNPIYRWTRNKLDINPNDDRMVQLPDSGTIVINRPEDKDEGIFQCFAMNEYGTSTTININLRKAMLEPFPFPFSQVMTLSVTRGHSVKMPCIPPTSIPKAEVTWVLKDPKDGRIWQMNFNNRITMDLEGNLYLTHMLQEDYREGKTYFCMARNHFMRKSTISPGFVINPVGSSGIDDYRPPHYLWSTPNEILGLLGESLKIKCIYGGNPTPEIHWKSSTPGRIPDNRRTLSEGGQELIISQLEIGHQGSYTCYTIGPSGNLYQRSINIIVKSRPFWVEGGEPKDIEARIGASATFICNAAGDPKPYIDWYINGIKLDDNNYINHPTVKSNRFLKPNDNNVTIVNLQKSDVMVLQCNASNIHGYVFADFYLNVMGRR